VDKNAGIVRIPIDQAMDKVLQKVPGAKGGTEAMTAARIITALLALSCIASAQLQAPRPAVLNKAGVDQKMGAQAPLDLAFNDETGRRVTMREFAGKPVILALVYYQCPSLCNMILTACCAA